MQKFLKNGLLLMTATTLLFTACDPEDGTETMIDGPTLTLTSQLENSYPEGAEVDLSYEFDAPGRIGQVIFEIFIDGTSSNSTTFTESELGFNSEDTTGAFTITVTVPQETAGSIITAEVEFIDRENQSTINDDAEFEIIQAINSYSATLIGGFNNLETGSFYDALADSVYSASSVRNSVSNQGNIDFLYYFSDPSQRTIASPDNSSAQITWEAQDPNAYPFTTTENSTRFKIAAAGTNFNFINTNEQIAAAFSEVGNETERVTNLQAGSLVAFRIDAARGTRYGVFQVTNVSGNSSGSITIDVKTQSIDN